MRQPCIELVVYTVKNAHEAETVRRAMRPLFQKFPGFTAWHAVTATDNAQKFADVVFWTDEA